MATLRPAARPLSSWKAALRQARASKAQRRTFADLTTDNRPKALHANGLIKRSKVHNPIKTYPPPPTATAKCKDAIGAVTASQLSVLDPTGARAHLFSRANKEAARVGDILLVRQKNGDPFAGVCLNIRRRGVDTAILLRNQLTRVGVEMWYKVFSPNVEGIEVVQRREKRARRARLYYMRKPKHDLGSVENIVRQYQRQRAMLRSGGGARGRDANSGKKAGKKGK
ncbi:Ribosomal protein L19 [Macrophomina phaseolina MS6]|uniref:Ribosomal protein L19 n=1 Tax=Macrophomina phaseolina (strain MS6) TaxID=1126212 RepID=K2RWD3_MACPH|nr:Ribosomal protein L19 [Macrophomina phaseolina MS6]